MNIIYKALNRLFQNNHKSFFKVFCIKNFKNDKKYSKNNILIEMTNMQPNILPSSYLSNLLSDKFNAKIISYQIYNLNFLSKLEWTISNFFNLREFSVYRSFNVEKFMKFEFDTSILGKTFRIFFKVLPLIKNKAQLENFYLNGVFVGDLIYDGFLKKYQKVTVNVNSLKFKVYLFFFIGKFFWFLKITKNYRVKALLVSHTVYELALPLRIAIKKKIPVYQCDIHHIRFFNKKNFSINEFKKYKKTFKKYKYKIPLKDYREAKKRLMNRVFKSKIDLSYTENISNKNYSTNFILEKNKINILVASHCFSDSPHGYGNHFFPDFYEWFEFLSKVAKKTNYNWYIKTHPDFKIVSKNFINEFVSINKEFKILPSDISHKLLVKSGINLCLTVYGTVGEEYPFYGVPVINATRNNPHINYNFNINPKNIGEYKKILLNLHKVKFNFNKEEVYECYYMKNFFYKNHLFVNDMQKLVKDFQGYKNIFNDKLYSYLIKKNLQKNHNLILRRLKKFINSKKTIFSILD
jgi:hypothetical protein